MKNFLKLILAVYAKLTLILHKPKIIGITGSVGKSSIKDAVALVLAQKFHVGSTTGNLNSDIGLPLAILGFKKAGGFKRNISSFFGWLWIIIAGFFRIFQFNYPEILVLEMGTDKPGDIQYLLSIVGRLDTAIITDIGISHLEFFDNNTDTLASEKLSILKGLRQDGVAILNADNSKVLQGQNKTHAKIVTYGFGQADVQAKDYKFIEQNGQKGIEVTISFKDTSESIFIPNAIGKPAVYACVAAAAVGISQNMNLSEISKVLPKYSQPAGRLRIIEGMNNTIILDDTYNSAPSSTIAALEALTTVSASRKLVILGHMAELGAQSESGQREVATKIMESHINLVFLVGEKTRVIEQELQARKFANKVYWLSDRDQAVTVIKQNLSPGDAILVKGSQSARMEKIVKQIMANPEQAEKLLVRQSKQWQE